MEPATFAEVVPEHLELIRTLPVAYLSTVGVDGFPQTRAVFNLRCLDRFPNLAPLYAADERDFVVYTTTNTSSRKMEEIRLDPSVCLYFCRPEEYLGLMLTGRIEIVTAPEVKQRCWQPGWERYYPLGPTDPDYSILRLRPDRMKGWHRGRPFAFDLPFTG